MISRRQFLSAMGMTALPASAWAQGSGAPVPRIGYMGPPSWPYLAAFVSGLGELGYVDGATMRLERRWPALEGRAGLEQLAKDLVAASVDVVATVGTPATAAAVAATGTVPIVMISVGDPVGSGFVRSLSNPGGNVTGVSVFTVELAAKQLEVLRELVPRASKIAVLWNPANSGAGPLVRQFEEAARRKGVSVTRLAASRPEELDTALAPLAPRRFDALFVHAEAMFAVERPKIMGLVGSARVPALYPARIWAVQGGLASFGADFAEGARRAGVMVAKILKGARPADLPVEQPTKFELVINRASRES